MSVGKCARKTSSMWCQGLCAARVWFLWQAALLCVLQGWRPAQSSVLHGTRARARFMTSSAAHARDFARVCRRGLGVCACDMHGGRGAYAAAEEVEAERSSREGESHVFLLDRKVRAVFVRKSPLTSTNDNRTMPFRRNDRKYERALRCHTTRVNFLVICGRFP